MMPNFHIGLLKHMLEPDWPINQASLNQSQYVWAAFAAPAGDVGGRCCADCQVPEFTDGPTIPANPGLADMRSIPSACKRAGPGARRCCGERF
jgi:hypothetical protein